MRKNLVLCLVASSVLLSVNTGCKTKKENTNNVITVDGVEFIDLNKDGQLQPYEDPRLSIDERVTDLMSRLSVDEKADLLIGTGMASFGDNNFEEINPVVGENNFAVPGAAGTTTPLEKYGIRAVVMTDGPAGVRITPIRENDKKTYYATGFPIGTVLASTWDVELVKKIGGAIGNEALEYGSDVQLAPALNIMRDPLCGRNYEYYSEDPVVAGKIAAAATEGIQSQNVAASIKHFAVNNEESNRMTLDVRLSQRALREIYLRGFEIAVKDANPKTVMSSYNKLDGLYTSASKDLLTTILRDEWGFQGLVMTDWFGGYPGFKPGDTKKESNTLTQLLAGNDLLMPGIQPQKQDILKGIADGKITEADIDINVRRVLRMIFESPTMNGYKFSDSPDLKAHAEITRQAASDGMILLKNDNQALPLSPSIKTIAPFGMTSFNFIAGGSGSGDVHKAYTVSLKEGLENAGYTIDPEMENFYAGYVKSEKERIAKIKAENQYAPVTYTDLAVDKSLIEKKAKADDIAIITIGRSSGEFIDRKNVKGDYLLTDDEFALIKNTTEAFHKEGKKVIVVLNVGGVMETASWKDLPDAILLAWFPGQEGGNSVADILKGNVNPSGKLTMTFPVNYTDIPASKNFPGVPADNPKYVDYKEGVYVGYRYFTSFNVKPSYEFGYGLSYTTFDVNNAKLSNTKFDGDNLTISVDVKNTGKIAGKEVVQIYLSAPKGNVDKPVKELKAFAKTKELQPGESQTLQFTINKKDLSSFDPSRSAWIADAGSYKVEVSTSSLDVKETLEFSLGSELVVEKVHDVLNNTGDFTDLKR